MTLVRGEAQVVEPEDDEPKLAEVLERGGRLVVGVRRVLGGVVTSPFIVAGWR